MEFKGTKEEKAKHYAENWEEITGLDWGNPVPEKVSELDYLAGYNQALKDSEVSEMLEMLEDVCENLALQLDRLGVCGEGDGKGRKADADSYGGTELLYRAKQLIKELTEIN